MELPKIKIYDEKDKILKDLESKIMDYEVLKRKNIRKSIEK